VVQSAIGGENVTTTVEGRERYPVNVRYMRDFRGDFGALERVLVEGRVPPGLMVNTRNENVGTPSSTERGTCL
jgi:Cu(I)/Ag(I) efflux system membrane protein CusA/SilA